MPPRIAIVGAGPAGLTAALALRRLGPEVTVFFGHRVVAASAAGDAAVLHFADGASEPAGIVLACDGAGSAIRASLRLPARRRRLRRAYLRGVADIGWQQPRIRELWYPDGRIFGMAPLPGARTYFYCSAPLGRWPQSLHGGLDAWIASWAGCDLMPPAILAAVKDWTRVNYDEPLEVQARRWYRTPVFLVGDAAHAMTPYLGQGANSALVDALVLSRLLTRELPGRGDLEAVGRRYTAIRSRFTRRLQAGSRRQGDLATLRWAPARWSRDRLLPVLGSAGRLEHRAALVTAGFNRAEQELLSLGP